MAHAGVTILTFTGRTGDLLAPELLDMLGALFLANDTDLDLLIGGLAPERVWLRALQGGNGGCTLVPAWSKA